MYEKPQILNENYSPRNFRNPFIFWCNHILIIMFTWDAPRIILNLVACIRQASTRFREFYILFEYLRRWFRISPHHAWRKMKMQPWGVMGNWFLFGRMASALATRCIAGCRKAAAPRATLPRAARHCRCCRNKIYFNLKMRCNLKLGLFWDSSRRPNEIWGVVGEPDLYR